jgi:hypothetical protein
MQRERRGTRRLGSSGIDGRHEGFLLEQRLVLRQSRNAAGELIFSRSQFCECQVVQIIGRLASAFLWAVWTPPPSSAFRALLEVM